MPFTTQLRTISRPFIQQSHLFKRTSIRMSSTNEHGQGASHATGQSAVPKKVQEAAPKGLEESLPEGVHPTGSNPNSQSTSKTHALNDGEDSIVPKKVQEIVPESVERALPNSIHNTGDQ
ncbi:uncharacterized protein J4E88_000329 [Alternaria novae-zelandiae]|uniref:uncharacterized protein n=2 Tax=Alternaria sect. Infectoriae TaxID=2499258 RepID=UPI0020C44C4A|nr:uncharacterized protein J4E83_003048 [Alternaria metachromatica]XP_049208633.1 uncharacterized protein J4E79_007924 [Alternaria viburni]XP_049224363.1 uncharacterized protein J4E78_003055 [Alternaria triticimaculans]XP_049259837.1 uncharacterized protein J4E88_000329 [Alternaria novae-zelandiae]KAI4630411.1 hypothetical protein J4E80_001346 [Alternaria sp. BMP 0032]KAI4699928.1 hypothetical protein J4E81_003961 [Alternaria sp. BMP 2799]KAI4628498.1 hypothetical protein J4E83_003048 [Altern